MTHILIQYIVLILATLLLMFFSVFLISQFWTDISNMKLKRRFGLPYVPTSRKRLKKILEFAEISSNDKVIDLGSGDGRMVIAAAKLGANATGYELNPVLVFWSIIKIKLLKLDKKATIIKQDLFNADLNNYNIFLLYTMPWVMDEVEMRLKNMTFDSVKIISNTFQFGDLKPIKTATKEKVYLYEIKKTGE